MATESNWIRFVETAWPGKTKRWRIETLAGLNLGVILWYGAWRQYCFQPSEMTTFERKCLRDIATFCETETRKQLKDARLRRLTYEEKVGG
jgi:hypothetical protein